MRELCIEEKLAELELEVVDVKGLRWYLILARKFVAIGLIDRIDADNNLSDT